MPNHGEGNPQNYKAADAMVEDEQWLCLETTIWQRVVYMGVDENG